MPLSHLVVCDYTPRTDQTSGGRRLVALMELFAADADTYFAYVDYKDPQETSVLFQRCGLNHVRLTADTKFSHPRAAFTKQLYDFALIQAWRVAERAAGDARRLQPWCLLVVDTVDVHFVREEAAARLNLLEPRLVAENKCRELAIYRQADALITVTDDDRAALVAEGLTQPIFLIPNIVPLLPRETIARKRELSFIGGFSHPPNIDGLLWFVNECWPLIVERIPDVQLTIVGSNPTPEVHELAKQSGIVYAGCVPATAPYLQAAAVSIAPLRYGGGMKGKVCEALAAGVPVVTTTVGIQGIPARDRVDFRLADQPQDFAQAVIELLQDPVSAERIGENGRQLISRICGPVAAAAAVSELLEWVRSHPEPSRWQKIWWRLSRVFWKGYLRCRTFLNQQVRAHNSKQATDLTGN